MNMKESTVHTEINLLEFQWTNGFSTICTIYMYIYFHEDSERMMFQKSEITVGDVVEMVVTYNLRF